MKKKLLVSLSVIMVVCILFASAASAIVNLRKVADFEATFTYETTTNNSFLSTTGYIYVGFDYQNNGINNLTVSLIDSSDNIVASESFVPSSSGSKGIQFGGNIPNASGYKIKFSASPTGGCSSIYIKGSVYNNAPYC